VLVRPLKLRRYGRERLWVRTSSSVRLAAAVWEPCGWRGDGLIKRSVALKLPHSGPHGRYLAEHFASERDILAELSHPNIARLYDAGFAEDGQPFLALEYVAGAPLIDYCDQQRVDVRQRLRLFQQVLRAVQYAHDNLVIHRNLKPSNVIVGNDGRAMLPRMTVRTRNHLTLSGSVLRIRCFG
jgi:serine/threonine protein kinase